MSSSPTSPAVALAITPSGPGTPAAWAGPLIVLGSRLRKYASRVPDRQVIVVISVPRRDFVAALIGSGWMLSSPVTKLEEPIEVMRRLEAGTPVRVVTDQVVLADYFHRLNESTHPPRVRVGGTEWHVHKVRAIHVLPALQAPARAPRPAPGFLGERARLLDSWDDRLARPAADLAFAGTLKWLAEDLSAVVASDGQATLSGTQIRSLLLPKEKDAATWSTRLFAAANLADRLPLAADVKAVILDGAAAIRYLAEIEVPAVLAILDRSVADESAAELVIQMRNTRGEPVSVNADLGWDPPAGIEAMAFTVAL